MDRFGILLGLFCLVINFGWIEGATIIVARKPMLIQAHRKGNDDHRRAQRVVIPYIMYPPQEHKKQYWDPGLLRQQATYPKVLDQYKKAPKYVKHKSNVPFKLRKKPCCGKRQRPYLQYFTLPQTAPHQKFQNYVSKVPVDNEEQYYYGSAQLDGDEYEQTLYRPADQVHNEYHDIKPVTEHIEDDIKYDFRTKTHSYD